MLTDFKKRMFTKIIERKSRKGLNLSERRPTTLITLTFLTEEYTGLYRQFNSI